jgi:hypothetical protein
MTCPACNKRPHTAEDLKQFHPLAGPRLTPEQWKELPFAGHGFVKGQGWSHPVLEAEAGAA